MKPKLIMMSHGNFAQELFESAKMIVGDAEGVYTVAMSMEDGAEGTKEKLNEVLAQIGNDEPILIAVDLFHGTPCNVAVQTMYERENVRVLTGLSLAVAIDYAVSDTEDLNTMCLELKEVAEKSIRIVEKKIPTAISEEGYED